MSVLMYIDVTDSAPVYLCDHFNAVSDVLFYGTRSNINGKCM